MSIVMEIKLPVHVELLFVLLLLHVYVVVHCCLCLKLLENNGTYIKRIIGSGGRIIGRNVITIAE